MRKRRISSFPRFMSGAAKRRTGNQIIESCHKHKGCFCTQGCSLRRARCPHRAANSGRRIDGACSGASHPQGVCRIRKAAEPPTAALWASAPTHRTDVRTETKVPTAGRRGRRPLQGARFRPSDCRGRPLDVPNPRAAARVPAWFAAKSKVPAAAGWGQPALRIIRTLRHRREF